MIDECQLCGACCFSDSSAYVPVTDADRERLGAASASELHKESGGQYMPMRDGHCSALHIADGVFTCSIYHRRPEICRELERGTPACHEEKRLKKAGALRLLATVAVTALVAACAAESTDPGPDVECGETDVTVNLAVPADLAELRECTTLFGSLRVGDSGLAAMDGLERLRTVHGDVNFFRNPDLVSLSGLGALRTVGGDLLVHHNAILADLDGLAELNAVHGDLYITNNPELPSAEAAAFAARVDVGGDVDLEANGP